MKNILDQAIESLESIPRSGKNEIDVKIDHSLAILYRCRVELERATPVAWIGQLAIRDLQHGNDPVISCYQNVDNPIPLYTTPLAESDSYLSVEDALNVFAKHEGWTDFSGATKLIELLKRAAQSK